MSTGKEISKENKSFQDKLRQLFRKAGPTPLKLRVEFALTDEIQRELSRDSSITVRTKAIKDLCELVVVHRLEDKSVEKLWKSLEDLLFKDQSNETRHLVFSFLQCLLKGQYERLGMMRAQFFRIVKTHDHPDDIGLRFDLLQALTDNGKDILYFEYEMGPFLLNWLPEISRVGKTPEYLAMLTNFIKYNASYIEADIAAGLVDQMDRLCCTSMQQATVLDCLQVMDTIVAYSRIPSASLPRFIATLCRIVNGEPYCQMCWKVMRNLLGTHEGHHTMYIMCHILGDPRLREDSWLLRGAVFFIQMGLWSVHCLTTLRCTTTSVLPSILKAAETNQASVIYEVMMAMDQLIKKSASELEETEWDLIIDILTTVVHQTFSNFVMKAAAPDVTPNQRTVAHLHDVFDAIENLIEVGTFKGSKDRFYEVIEECTSTRPEPSVLRLISHLAKDMMPTKHLWLSNLYSLVQKYYRQETRTTIRLKVLSVISTVIKLNRLIYEDELIDGIVVPHLIHIVNDPDEIVRTAVAELLIDLCKECDSKRCLDLLDILDKLITKPFDYGSPDAPANDSETADIKSAVFGLINVFVHKIHRLPSLYAVRIYKMLVNHLEQHYIKPKIFEECNQIRYKILDCFLKMRCDHLYRIGYSDSATGKFRYSPYLCITYRYVERGPMGSPPPISPAAFQQPPCIITYVPLRRVFKIFITCLKQEKDWEVLQLVLQGVPQVLQNRSLILSKQGNNEIDLLVDTLSSMITDRSLCLPESLKHPMKPSRSDFHAAVLMVVASLVAYHGCLGQVHQQRMIRLLVKYGLVPRCSKQCIMALTICTLEMRDVMVKMLPEVLLDLSKISATVLIAVPVLEFLSTLAKIPMVFANFVGDQYMAVFAISLPFTNPFKYNHYIVSLAHHVIAVWFLKCRLPFRRDFITYITKGLQTNVLVPFEETNLRTNLSSLNEDSSNRKRSSSLTEQSSRRRERASTMARPDGKPALDFRPVIDRTLLTFYEELTETCIDLMAHYTFSSCSALPKRSPTMDHILQNGHSMTWFYGNKLITITTSGCSLKALKHGLCDNCWQRCRLESLKSPEHKVAKSAGGEKEKEEPGSTHMTRQNSGEKSNNNTSTSSPIEENKKLSDKLEQLPLKLQQLDSSKCEKQACTCWCQNWAEIYIRRATGDISWMMRIENQPSDHLPTDHFPFDDVSNIFMPSICQYVDSQTSTSTQQQSDDTPASDEALSSAASVPISIPGSPCKQSPSRQSSRDSIDEDMEENVYEDGSKSRNPVRRSNSSPEMSASWKNPFLQKQDREVDDSRMQEDDGSKKSKTFTKDMRVSCEAIPEEIAGMGTTPPSNEPVSSSKDSSLTTPHPTLLSCHSYPGSAPQTEQTVAPKSAHTVPPSPNIIHSTAPLTLPIRSSILKSSKSESVESVGPEKTLERPSVLTGLSSLPPLSSKPPQSPTQTSPRLPRHVQTKEGHEIQKSSSLNLERTHSLKIKEKKGEGEKLSQLDLSQAQKRDRGYTISVMSTIRKPRLENIRQTITSRPKEAPRSGISPSFVFLQMYHSAEFGNTGDKPLLISSSQVVQRAVKVLDCIPPYETHRIGVIYVGEGQCNKEIDILRNCYGSFRYIQFLNNLGTFIKLDDVDPQVVFLGGLEQKGKDGNFTYIWQDDVIRVTFHIATLMPNRETDPNCTAKKAHIGNNNVTIVYNESGEEYNINTIKGQFNFACIIVQPLDHQTCKVTVKAKEELKDLMGTYEPKIVSDQNVALLARQLALHADLASLVSRSLKSQSQDPYASNWLERLRKIKNVRAKILQETKREHPAGAVEDSTTRTVKRMEDFSDYM